MNFYALTPIAKLYFQAAERTEQAIRDAQSSIVVTPRLADVNASGRRRRLQSPRKTIAGSIFIRGLLPRKLASAATLIAMTPAIA
jgi:hypothetical protein